MEKMLHRDENETQKKDLLNRVVDLVLLGVEQKKCSKYENCNHVVEQISAVNFNIPEAEGYLTLICEHYPNACKLNLGNKQLIK